MAVDPRLKALSGTSRRNFLRWVTAASVAVGLDRAGLLNFLNESGGTAMADTLAASKVMRSFWLRAGTGGFANFQLLWPHVEVAKAGNAAYAFPWAANQVADAATDRPSVTHPGSPFVGLPKSKQITAMMWSQNQTHTNVPNGDAAAGISTLAAMAAIQQAEPTLLPVIAVTPFNFGTAPGAPAAATVADPDGLIDLFNSAASRALMSTPANGELGEAYYKAFLGLNAAAGRTTVAKQYGVGKVSMNLLSKNLSLQLTPTAADEALFGITGTTPGAVTQMSRAMITTVKAFSLGLTSMLMMPAFNDDPHGLFAGGDAQALAKAQAMGKMLDGLYEFAKTRPDPSCATKSLADQIVFSVTGDTFKAPFNRDGWGDGTPQNSNLLYIMGNGLLKSGWFGNVGPNGVTGWTPGTGVTEGAFQGRGPQLAQAAMAAGLYAVSGGDMAAVRDKINAGAIDGVINNALL